MKKLALALLCAMSVATVSAAAEQTAEQKLDAAKAAQFKSLNLSKVEQKGILSWMSQHKVATTAMIVAAIALVYAGTMYGAYTLQDQDKPASADGKTAEHKAAWYGRWSKNVYDYGFGKEKDWITGTAAWKHVSDNKWWYIGGTIAAAVILGAVYDLAIRDQSALKTLWNKMVGEEQKAVTPVPATPAVA